VLGEALATEFKRIEKEKEKNELNREISEEYKALIMPESDEEQSNDEDTDDDNNDLSTIATRPKRKLTKADRNRQARNRKKEWAETQQSKQKKLLKSINGVGDLLKGVKHTEVQGEKRRAQLAQWKEENLSAPPPKKIGGKVVKDNLTAVAVALSDEITGSLRTIKPKVHVAKDRFDSLHERNMIEVGDKNRPQRKIKSRTKILHKR